MLKNMYRLDSFEFKIQLEQWRRVHMPNEAMALFLFWVIGMCVWAVGHKVLSVNTK